MKSWVMLITAAFLFIGCSPFKAPDISYPTSFSFQTGSSQIHVRLEALGRNINRIHILTINNKEIVNSRAALLPWPVYQFQMGDIDGDNVTDLFVGVIKSCKYDPVVRRRLFAYEVIDGDLRPKWLGTHIAYDIKEFRTVSIDGRTYIRALEKDESGIYHIMTYAWTSFGPRIKHNEERGKDYDEAFKIFNGGYSYSDSLFMGFSDWRMREKERG
jgi:hypothetical protein